MPNGLITRRAYPTVRVTVEYGITPLGRSILELVEPVRKWAINSFPEVQQA